ncbi:MAG: phosphoribosylanthranilate isomerase [Duncaniella sp.]|nr:phosphoribosylanthranilate isomerase [Duncaniella sp.]
MIPSIKICGMTLPDNIREVAALRPEWLGMIFHPASPRNACSFRPDTLTDIRRGLSDDNNVSPRFVGVFVNRPANDVVDIAATYHLDAVQLHGDETPDLCNALQGHGFEVWKAVGIESPDDFRPLGEYIGTVDRFVFDRKSPRRGGTGEKFDWRHLPAYTLPVGFMLGGGVGADDVEAVGALNHPQLLGFDLNSRFEISPGIKDVGLLARFIASIRQRHEN